MLPYFRSMEAFFDLSLPKSWTDLSDPQLLFLLLHDLLAIGLLTTKNLKRQSNIVIVLYINMLRKYRPNTRGRIYD